MDSGGIRRGRGLLGGLVRGVRVRKRCERAALDSGGLNRPEEFERRLPLPPP
jgi:hypothetical protein